MAFDHVRLADRRSQALQRVDADTELPQHQGGRQVLHLPALAEVTACERRVPLALRPEHDELPLSASRGGAEGPIAWQAAARCAAPDTLTGARAGRSASNLGLSIQLPEDRWVLYAFGARRRTDDPLLGRDAAVRSRRSGSSAALASHAASDPRLAAARARPVDLLVAGAAAFVRLRRGISNGGRDGRRRATRGQFNLLQVALRCYGGRGTRWASSPPCLGAARPIRTCGVGARGSWRACPGSSTRRARSCRAVGVLSVSLWWYRLAMLAWALWLSFALTRWVRWAWQVPRATACGAAVPAPRRRHVRRRQRPQEPRQKAGLAASSAAGGFPSHVERVAAWSVSGSGGSGVGRRLRDAFSLRTHAGRRGRWPRRETDGHVVADAVARVVAGPSRRSVLTTRSPGALRVQPDLAAVHGPEPSSDGLRFDVPGRHLAILNGHQVR